MTILYCLLWQVIVWPPPLPIPSLSIVLIHAEQESPVFWSLSNSSLLSQVATRTAHKCLSSPWRHVAEMYILAPQYHSEVRCDLLWPINISSTCVSSKWWFMNQCTTWPSSVPGTQCELTLRGASISLVPRQADAAEVAERYHVLSIGYISQIHFFLFKFCLSYS